MKKGIVIGLFGLGCIGLTAGYFWLREQPESTTSNTQTARVQLGELVEQVAASGSIKPDVQVEVKSLASGEVIELAVEPGDQVEAGKLLVRLDPIDEERTVNQNRASLASARARLAQAKASLDISLAEAQEAEARYEVRRKGLAKGLISTEEHRTAENAALVARNSVALREADLLSAQSEVNKVALSVAEAKRRLEETIIKAPISGTVLSVLVEKGTIISSGITNVGGGTTLLTLADLSKLYVVGALDEANIGKVRPGQDVDITVDAYQDRIFRGKVERVSPLGVNTSNIVTFDVQVVVTDRDAYLLRPGMSADLEIVVSKYKDVLLIPVAAIRSQGKERYVLLASGKKRSVRTGETDGIRIIILEGLKEGEELVVAGAEPKPSESSRPRLFGPRRKK